MGYTISDIHLFSTKSIDSSSPSGHPGAPGCLSASPYACRPHVTGAEYGVLGASLLNLVLCGDVVKVANHAASKA